MEDAKESLIKIERMKCCSNKKVKLVCCNDKCLENCFLCGQVDCKCYLKHSVDCKYYFLDPLIKGIQKQRNKSTLQRTQWETSLGNTLELYDKLIDDLNKKKNQLKEYIKFYFGLYYNSYKFVKTVQEDQKYNEKTEISGQLISKMLHEISASENIIRPFSKAQLMKFQDQYEKSTSLLQKNLQSLHIKNIMRMEYIKSSILTRENEFKLYYTFDWNISKIIPIKKEKLFFNQIPILIIGKLKQAQIFGIVCSEIDTITKVSLFSFDNDTNLKYQDVSIHQNNLGISFIVPKNDKPTKPVAMMEFFKKKKKSLFSVNNNSPIHNQYSEAKIQKNLFPATNITQNSFSNKLFQNQNNLFNSSMQNRNKNRLFIEQNKSIGLFGNHQSLSRNQESLFGPSNSRNQESLFGQSNSRNQESLFNLSNFQVDAKQSSTNTNNIELETRQIFKVTFNLFSPDCCQSDELFGKGQSQQLDKLEIYQLQFSQQL